MKFLMSVVCFLPFNIFAQIPLADAKDTTTLAYILLKKGKLDMHLRMYYMTTQNEKELSDYHAWAFGAGLKYETGSFKGFQFGVGGFFVWNLGSSDLGKPDPQTGAANRYEIGQFDIEDPYNKNDMARLENFYFKYNVFSWLPYTLAFAALPSCVAISKDINPPVWMWLGGAIFGSAAHFINVIKDMDQDRASGIGGAPQRLGKRNSIVAAGLLIALGILVLIITI
jgi:hypothetical protein